MSCPCTCPCPCPCPWSVVRGPWSVVRGPWSVAWPSASAIVAGRCMLYGTIPYPLRRSSEHNENMMSTTTLRLQATRTFSSISSRSSSWAVAAVKKKSYRNAAVHMSRMMFSAQPAHNDKPLTPGIGLGKTSTGLVSFVPHVSFFLICQLEWLEVL